MPGARLRSGRSWRVFFGGRGPTLLWLHGPRGVDASDPLLEALPDATFVPLRRVDHFATPKDFTFLDKALEFIGAV